MAQKEYSIDDYYEFLKTELEKVIIEKEIIEEENKKYSKCCTYKNKKVFFGLEDLKNCFTSDAKRKNLEEVLKCLFGKDVYEDENIEAKEKLNSNFQNIYGKYHGYTFEKTNSWEELLNLLENAINFYFDNSILIKKEDKELFYVILKLLCKKIEIEYANNLSKLSNANFVINKFNDFINSYEKREKINITDRDKNLIKTILNTDKRKAVLLENEEIIGFGDVFVIFCERLNEVLKENQSQSKIDSKIDKYFKKISSKTIDELENKNFPKYSNDDYVSIIKGVIEKFQSLTNEDDKWVSHLAVTYMHYASYFKTKYYDSSKVFGLNGDAKGSK